MSNIRQCLRIVSIYATICCSALCVRAFDAAAAQILTFEFSGPGVSGSGYFTLSGATASYPNPCASCNTEMGYVVVAISGALNGSSISLRAAGPGNGGDDLIYFTQPYVDEAGIEFNLTNDLSKIYEFFWSPPGTDLSFSLLGMPLTQVTSTGYTLLFANGGPPYAYTPISFSIGIPEPASLTLLGLHASCFLFMHRRRRRSGRRRHP